MAVASFPQNFTDISATATKVMAAKPDGSRGYVTRPPGGETLQSIVIRGAATTGAIAVAGVSFSDGGIDITGISTGLKFREFGVSDYHLFVQKSTGNVGVGTGTPAQKLSVSGNIAATGTVSGTVFNPTSLRARKRDIIDYNGDPLKDINELKLHTYHFREYESVIEKQAVYEEVTHDDGMVENRLISEQVMKDVEINNVDQMLNVGVILDEIDNPLIADQNRGCLNLNNIVFLLVGAVQQLTLRVKELESK